MGAQLHACYNYCSAYNNHFLPPTVHVTDVHNALERVEQLKSWLTTRKQRVDVILISGDVADGPMDWSLSDEEVKKHQNDLDAIVAGFTQVRNEVYYIPGNVSTEVVRV